LAQKSFLSTQDTIEALAKLGDALKSTTPDDEAVYQRAYYKNNWFTRANVELAINSIANEFLNRNKLNAFAEKYNLFQRDAASKTVGLVFAGNIPLVGFMIGFA
jgi:hypothetical protein